MTSPTDMGIVSRLTDFFQRQSAWLERLQGELVGITEALEADDLDELVSKNREWETRNAAFAEEFVILKKEWDDTVEISASDRQLMREKSGDVEQLAQAVRELFLDAANVATKNAESLKIELDELNKGRGVAEKFRAPTNPESSYFDSNM